MNGIAPFKGGPVSSGVALEEGSGASGWTSQFASVEAAGALTVIDKLVTVPTSEDLASLQNSHYRQKVHPLRYFATRPYKNQPIPK